MYVVLRVCCLLVGVVGCCCVVCCSLLVVCNVLFVVSFVSSCAWCVFIVLYLLCVQLLVVVCC